MGLKTLKVSTRGGQDRGRKCYTGFQRARILKWGTLKSVFLPSPESNDSAAYL
jgi:hypothetical protein